MLWLGGLNGVWIGFKSWWVGLVGVVAAGWLGYL